MRVDGRAVERDLLLGLAQRRGPEVLAGLLTPAGEADLAAVAAQVLGPAGEHDVGLAVEPRTAGRAPPRPAPSLSVSAGTGLGSVRRAPARTSSRLGRRRSAGEVRPRARAGPAGIEAGLGICWRPPRSATPSASRTPRPAPASRSGRPPVFRFDITRPGGVSPRLPLHPCGEQLRRVGGRGVHGRQATDLRSGRDRRGARRLFRRQSMTDSVPICLGTGRPGAGAMRAGPEAGPRSDIGASGVSLGLHHPAHAAHATHAAGMPPPASPPALGLVGDERLGGEEQAGDRRRVLQRRTGHLGRVDDAGLEQVDELAGGGVEADGAGLALDLLHDDRTLETGVVGDEPSRRLERPVDRTGTGGLVALERLDGALATAARARSRAVPPPATTPSSMAARVAERASSMRCFFSLSSTSVAAPTLTTATPPASLARRSWSFSRSQSESVSSISRLICAMRPLTSSSDAGALDDGGVVLGDDDLAGLTEQVERGVVELEADLFGDDLATGEDGHVGQHRLAALAEAGGLDGDRVEGAADLVDDERGQGLALDVLGDDQQRLAATA